MKAIKMAKSLFWMEGRNVRGCCNEVSLFPLWCTAGKPHFLQLRPVHIVRAGGISTTWLSLL